MNATPLQEFYSFLTRLGWKDRAIEILKPHGVTSFKHLSPQKQEEVVDVLKLEWKNRSKRPRGAVIHYMCIMPEYNYKTLTGDPDYDKIDEWVKSKMHGKALNQLTLSELNIAVSMVKQWYNKQLKK